MEAAVPGRKAVILRVLPEVGGEAALRAAVAETGNTDSRVQTAAVYALSQWPDYAAAGELLRIATTTASKRHRLLAVDGYVRLVGRANMAGPRKIALFESLLAQPFDDADKKLVVAGAAAVREPESLRLLARYLDNPVLGETGRGRPPRTGLGAGARRSAGSRATRPTPSSGASKPGPPTRPRGRGSASIIRRPPAPGRLRAALRRPHVRGLERPRRRSAGPGQDDAR
ncbi:MAG: hypothetical protein MZW92_61150 [Comamonadaceae bacterium]|nr:hypothetical protein [Comamonadaceae bacterium]